MVFDFSNYCCFLDPVPFLFPFLDCCLQEIRAVFRFQLFASALRFAVFFGGGEGGDCPALFPDVDGVSLTKRLEVEPTKLLDKQ